MLRRHRVLLSSIAATAAGAAAFASASLATAPPVGPLPPGPLSRIQTTKGELIAFALPHRGGGRAWRIARTFDARVLRQVGEADVGKDVVLVFRATGRGTTTVSFGLTLGERAKAYESRRYAVSVRT